MASPTSSAVVSPKKYDVFISIRGQDTHTYFTRHLRDAFYRNKIETYIDDRLEKGDELWPSIVKAIQNSALFLIVFSENYASSTWCLNELTKIVERSRFQGLPVIPVFYNIDPSHVRKQTGSYQIAFKKHELTNHKQQVPEWMDALHHVGNLAGWHISGSRDEAKLIGEIVEYVLQRLEKLDLLSMSQIIGIHEQIVHLESLLCRESQDVRFIGIWGPAGIGKTTLARVLFEKLSITFESSCFLANVGEELKKHGITGLKTKLLSTLLEDETPNVGMLDGGSIFVSRRLRQKKVLVVLDDVNLSEQLKSLVGAHDCFGPGSRVIITTRNRQALGVEYIYEVKALCFDDALQLFSFKTFKLNCPYEEFEQLSWEVVNYAGGLPFALVVLGFILCGRGKEEWKNLLEKLKKGPPKEIQQVLELSYDNLNYEEKSVFLDIACFLKGRRMKQVEILLDACGHFTSNVLESLQDKALLTIYDEKVYMHGLIQEMGLEIVRQECLENPGRRSRLWDPKDIYEVLKYNKGSEAIIGISLDVSKIEELKVHHQVFSKMTGLKFLNIYDSTSEEHHLYLPQGHLQIINHQSVDKDDDDDDDDNEIHNVFYQMDATNLTSDHVFLSYTDEFCSILHRNIRESKPMENSKILYKIDVLLLVLDNDKRKWQKHCEEIKECGVCPTSVLEYQNFIKQMEMKSQASASEMGVKDHHFKGLIFPAHPTTNWMNRTQGLKDITNL